MRQISLDDSKFHFRILDSYKIVAKNMFYEDAQGTIALRGGHLEKNSAHHSWL